MASEFENQYVRPMQLSRRSALLALGVGIGGVLGANAWAQEAGGAAAAPMALPLPLERICGHVGISVPDVEKSALFYSKLFGGQNVNGEKTPSLRYFITLGGGGSVAIGKLGTLGSVGKTVPLIDHYCVGAKPFNDAQWRARLKAEGLMYIAQGVFGDPEGLFVQVAGGQGGESLSAGAVGKLPTLYSGPPLVKADGYEHISVHVPDVQKEVAFCQKFFGLQVDETVNGEVFMKNALAGDDKTRLAIAKCDPGEGPIVHHIAVRVPKFDKKAMSESLTKLGAKILPTGERNKGALRFADPDGLIVEFWPV